jgi:NADH-quinone oxidoreductase subunit E
MEQQVSQIVAKYQTDPGSVIAILQDVQEEFNYLPREALERVSKDLAIPLSRVLSLGTACHVRGAQLVLEKFERELGLKTGETSADMAFSLDAVRCVGCCGLAPVVMVGEEVHGKISPAKVTGLVKKYKK